MSVVMTARHVTCPRKTCTLALILFTALLPKFLLGLSIPAHDPAEPHRVVRQAQTKPASAPQGAEWEATQGPAPQRFPHGSACVRCRRLLATIDLSSREQGTPLARKETVRRGSAAGPTTSTRHFPRCRHCLHRASGRSNGGCNANNRDDTQRVCGSVFQRHAIRPGTIRTRSDPSAQRDRGDGICVHGVHRRPCQPRP